MDATLTLRFVSLRLVPSCEVFGWFAEVVKDFIVLYVVDECGGSMVVDL